MHAASRRWLMALAALIAFDLPAAHAPGIIISPPAFDPAPGAERYIASWAGASAVPIAPQWLLTVRHLGGDIGWSAALNGESFTADQIVSNRAEDLQLIHVDRPFPGWHDLATGERAVVAGRSIILGGVGYRAGLPLPENNGFAWSDPGEAWGANTADQVGARIFITFDAPDSPAAVPGESIFVRADSGGGVFVLDEGNHLRLAGIATTGSSATGSTRFGDTAFAVNLDPWSAWITLTTNPGVPIASSVEAPYPPVRAPAPATAALLLLALTRRRRRRT